MLIGDLLRNAAARLPDKPAIVCGPQVLGYAALDRAANRLAHGLAAAGIGRADKVAILCRNRPEYAIAYFGVARSGAVLVHLSTRYTKDELAYVLDHTETELVLAERDFLPTLRALIHSEDVPRLVAIGAAAGHDGRTWEDLLEAQPDGPSRMVIDERDPYCISLTGGTTGFPKGAVSDHRARVTSARIGIEDLRLAADEVIAVGSPLYHAAGLITLFQSAIAAGCTCVLSPAWSPAGFTEDVARNRATTTLFVPTQVSLLIDDPAFDRAKLGSLKKLIYGGSPMPPELLARAEAALPHVAFVQNYGQTETGPLLTIWPDERQVRPASVGRAGSLIEIAVFRAPGVPAGAGEIGEIATRGAHVMSGYYNDAEQSAAFFKAGDGWGYTGDIGSMDADGYVTLIDRAKDVIISGGVNIYPAEIEIHLARHPAVRECAVFGIADKRWGELVAAEVVLAPGTHATSDALIAYCASRVAAFKRPRQIFIVESLPKTAGGKIQKTAIRTRHHAANTAAGREEA